MMKSRKIKYDQLTPQFRLLFENFKKDFWGDSLQVCGSFNLSRKNIGVIGGRRPSPYGKQLVEDLLQTLSRFDVNIVSGGALGIDALAHRHALDLGMSTWAWLVGPVENPSPNRNHWVFRNILKNDESCLLFPEALIPNNSNGLHKSYWLQRNIWLAASCDLLIVVEALAQSGTWSTVKAANRFGVPVLAFPGTVYSPLSEGPNLMISEGYAHPIINFSYLTSRIMDEFAGQTYNGNRESSIGALKVDEIASFPHREEWEIHQGAEKRQHFQEDTLSLTELFLTSSTEKVEEVLKDEKSLTKNSGTKFFIRKETPVDESGKKNT